MGNLLEDAAFMHYNLCTIIYSIVNHGASNFSWLICHPLLILNAIYIYNIVELFWFVLGPNLAGVQPWVNRPEAGALLRIKKKKKKKDIREKHGGRGAHSFRD